MEKCQSPRKQLTAASAIPQAEFIMQQIHNVTCIRTWHVRGGHTETSHPGQRNVMGGGWHRILMKMQSDRKGYKHCSFFRLGGVRKYCAVLLVSRIEEKGLAQHFHAMSANIHNLCRVWSWKREPVHPSPREMVVSSQTVVWNHT